jgi:hypothetical protein
MSWACACHVSFKDKVAGLTISQDAMPNRTKVRWWDDEVINSQFGGTPAERREQYMEETKGLGHVQADGSGRLWHKDRKDGEVKPLSEAQAVDAVGGPA